MKNEFKNEENLIKLIRKLNAVFSNGMQIE